MHQLRVLFAVLIGALSAIAALCVDLSDPFRGSFRITASTEQARYGAAFNVPARVVKPPRLDNSLSEMRITFVRQLAAIRSIIEADLCREELAQNKVRQPDCPRSIAECIEGVEQTK